jgi:protein associated with RNAse G/E
MKITVIKQDPEGIEAWRYSGKILGQDENYIILEAYFDRDDMDFHGMKLCKGDRFIEIYYFDRWYNIFEIHHHVDDHLKGWYCNVCSPAVIDNRDLTYKDYALDLLIFPDGRQVVLDEDEFNALALSPQIKKCSLDALQELKDLFTIQGRNLNILP